MGVLNFADRFDGSIQHTPLGFECVTRAIEPHSSHTHVSLDCEHRGWCVSAHSVFGQPFDRR